MDYSILDDQQLIHLVVGAHEEALGELYNRYGRLVFSLALHIVGDSASAEEITQEVFFRVWEKAETYRKEQAKVSTWLISITRYRSIDLLRRRSARPESNSIGWAELSQSVIPRTDGRDPEDLVERSILGQRIQAAIASLPLEQQRALALAYFRGYTHTEIAEELGEPLGTIKTRIRLAMHKLRRMLEDVQFTG